MSRRARGGPLARLGPLALAGLGSLALAGATQLGCAAQGNGSERLAVRGPAWSFAGRAVTLDVATSGALAEREVSLVVAVGSKVVARVPTVGRRARAVVAAEHLAAGVQSISVKSGSERCVIDVRIVPASYALAVALAVAVVSVIAAAAVARRRRRAVSR